MVSPEGAKNVLTSASLTDENTIEQPRKVAPVTRSASGFGADAGSAGASMAAPVARSGAGPTQAHEWRALAIAGATPPGL